ncbi:efflux RND transporter permease subunit [Pseudomonas putida]|uniref:efflux RND transporter permease subunit n=1 Tax=Pseudomonas putida TaxID=303 RepID=UPI002365112B|nr:MMPL family transporter [Pseudomonas putida]MDD2047526.1 MMPL family transporter [Pseudomonas putida]
MPVVSDYRHFDRNSGGWLERMVFNYRIVLLMLCTVLTVVLGYQLKHININASFERMIPQSHSYIRNYLDNKGELRGLGNVIRVVVERTDGDIFDPEYLAVLQRINDELILIPGVDRAWVKSIWTPAVRWMEVTEEGFTGGPVLPASYDGSPRQVQLLRQNINRAGLVGSLVGTDLKSAMIVVPLLDVDPATGQKLDYSALSTALEERIRSQGTADIKVHIIGFAKLVGDLIDGLIQVFFYFAIAAIVAAAIIYAYTRCLRSTTLVIACSIIAAIWQLGLSTVLGFDLDPYSMLVPFLVFAIGVSHGVQKMNGIMQDIGRGTHKFVAARYTFRRLFLAGATALVADAVGFAVLMVIDIPVIKGLALSASIGVAVLIFTNLLLLPVLLSFTGVGANAARRSLAQDGHTTRTSLWDGLVHFTSRRWATFALVGAAVLVLAGFAISTHLKIGDLDAGAPELRPDSRYNRDNAYITQHYSLSSDLFAVILKTPANGSYKYESLVEADRLAWALRGVPGVQMTTSLVDAVRQVTSGTFEGSPKWLTLSRNQDILNYGSQVASVNNPELFNGDASVMPVIAFLTDHKAQTLDQVLAVAERFIAEHSTGDRQFMLVAGSAGIEAATNIVVRDANRAMLMYVYAAVIVLSYITFRSWRAVLVAVIPLIMTSILCEALMVLLGIGVKVATLPVIALGVGIGIDYALYLLSIQLARQRRGDSLADAYSHAVAFTGKVVGLVGMTLAVGVVTWVFSPIKFQADMGILLAFMFVWNMLGALILVPALSHFLLPDGSLAQRRAVAGKVQWV